uniref:histone acetyltransferase n=1 Tax=Vombatus ursinus TaxID=29139 RepID=A0A4X2K3R2_VOMUR
MVGFDAVEKFLVEYKSAMEKKLAEYKCNTNEAIQLKLIHFAEDLDNDSTTFNPENSHQIFGDDKTMMLRAKWEKSFLQYFVQTHMILFHCWKRKLILRPLEHYSTGTQLNKEAEENITCKIYKADMTCTGFREYHERLQTFLT